MGKTRAVDLYLGGGGGGGYKTDGQRDICLLNPRRMPMSSKSIAFAFFTFKWPRSNLQLYSHAQGQMLFFATLCPRFRPEALGFFPSSFWCFWRWLVVLPSQDILCFLNGRGNAILGPHLSISLIYPSIRSPVSSTALSRGAWPGQEKGFGWSSLVILVRLVRLVIFSTQITSPLPSSLSQLFGVKVCTVLLPERGKIQAGAKPRRCNIHEKSS